MSDFSTMDSHMYSVVQISVAMGAYFTVGIMVREWRRLFETNL